MLKCASTTNIGSRKYNEDYLKISSVANRHCFVVCDGLGGHNYGDVAARIAGNAFIDELFYCEDLSCFLINAFNTAQRQIELNQKRSKTKQDMKTTLVCMATDETKIYIGHVGDSRFYGFKKDGTYIRTLDHSVPQLLVQSGTITESEIRNHPNRNMLLKVMGDKWDEPLCELSEELPLNIFSAFLLCSDGFWELVTEDDMISTLNCCDTPQEWLDKMIMIIENNNSSGEKDNYSAITIFV